MRILYRALPAAILLYLFCTPRTYAQSDKWTLQEAVQYALKHNISIQQNELDRRLAKLTLDQSRIAQLPNINGSVNYGRSYGRSIDPTSNQFVNGSYDFMGISGSADVLLFGWFQQRNRISQNKLTLEAAGKDLEQLKNDVSLNVATGYLRALLAKEQVNINTQQVALSAEQLRQTESFVESGRLPELNMAQLEAQLASDSANLISAITEYNAAILDIKALLNLDFNTPFEIDIPDIQDAEKDFDNAYMEPEEIYDVAVRRMANVKASQYRYKAAQKGFAAARGALFPQLSLSAQAGTNYSTLNRDFTVTGINEVAVPGSYTVDASGNRYQLYQLDPVLATNTIPLGQQLDNNFRQTVAFSLNIPLFNGWQSQTALKRARIGIQSAELGRYQTELKLRQDVYKAHNDARNSLQKYYAAKRSADAAQRAYEFARKRHELGLTNTVEYLVTQNNWSRAEANMASAKYDLIFKLKVIDYYLGLELKL